MMKPKKLGLVLGGGGAKGGYQIGVFKALIEANIFKHLTHVAGTSIGAINSVLVMSKTPYPTMMEVWKSLDNQTIYKTGFRGFDILKGEGMFDTDGLYAKIVPFVDKEKLRKTKIQGYAVIAQVPDAGILSRLRWGSYESEVIHLNTVADPFSVVRASAAFPIVFGSTKIEGKNYIDGGVADAMPVQALIDAGCETIITIGLSPDFNAYAYPEYLTIVDLTPDVSLGRFPMVTLNFATDKMIERIEYGYQNGLKMVAYLKANKYLTRRGKLRIKPRQVITINSIKISDKAD